MGLPLAVEFGKQFETIGFDVSAPQIDAYRAGNDPTGELSRDGLAAATKLTYHTDPSALSDADFVMIAVPKPVDAAHQPDFTSLVKSPSTVGCHLKLGATVVHESTLYPGATEEVCIPIF